MGRKKKKSKKKGAGQPVVRDEKLEDELQALQAIFEERFHILEDRLGCSVLIVPDPAEQHPQISALFEARCLMQTYALTWASGATR